MITAAIALLTLGLAPDNTLTPKEVKAGWKLLFDGKTTKGWHNFKAEGVGPGWVVENGVLRSANPGTAGDIVTDEQFDWFEFSMDFMFEPGENSGLMFHVAPDGEATWHSGPEIQIYDDKGVEGAQRTGWLYQLYSSKVDSTHPAKQWNSMRVIIASKKCETFINGVKYYDFVLNSPDFWDRVAKSKFSEHPQFSKLTKGSMGIQGDHGVVSFKNIKIRPLKG